VAKAVKVNFTIFEDEVVPGGEPRRACSFFIHLAYKRLNDLKQWLRTWQRAKNIII
jgi:hypothetical protein